MAKKTLKILKEEAMLKREEEDYSSALKIYEDIIEKYPKNIIGYLGVIELKTVNFKKYLPDSELKDLKKIYEKAYELSKSTEKDKLKKSFSEYLDDCSEVENLKRIKKDIVSNNLMVKLSEHLITGINNNINSLKIYNFRGKRITSIYDLIKGIFYIFCMIYNLINSSLLLILTIPLGVFGLVITYSFINTNLFGGSKSLASNISLKFSYKDKIKALKKELVKKQNNLNDLLNKKRDIYLRIPNDFNLFIKDIIEDNEEKIAFSIMEELISNNVAAFTYLINENTNLQVNDILNILNDNNMYSNDNKQNQKKQGEILLIKPLANINYIAMILLIIVSILCLIIILKNFYELDKIGFIAALVTGIISTLVYNINTGKHKAYSDTFNDSMITTVFNSVLVYDLIYSSRIGNIKFTYGFIQMTIIFSLIFSGLVSVISLLKYKNLINKLRK